MDIVKADSPQQLLLALPHLAGSGIARSVVILPFQGSRTGMAARIDLPATMPPGARSSWATRALDHLAAFAPDAIGIFVVTDDVIGSGTLPHRALVRALEQRARRLGVPVRAALCQASDAWGDYEEPGAAMGPIAELEVTDGLPFVPPVPAPTVPADASADQRHDVEVSIASLEEERDAARPHGDARVELDDLDDVPLLAIAAATAPVLLESALHEAVLTPDTAALVIAMLQAPPMRDVATVQWLDGLAAGMRAHDEAVAYLEHGTQPDPRCADRLMGKGRAPDADRLEQAVGLMESLVSLAPTAAQPALLTILGSLHWFLGRAGTAERCVLRALEIEPGYGMATLVAQMVQADWLPEWIGGARQPQRVAAGSWTERGAHD